MKTAKYSINTIEVHCPHCEGEVLDPENGSTFWELNQITPGQEVKCDNGHTFRLPKVPLRPMTSDRRGKG